jgi:hypothetical protein
VPRIKQFTQQGKPCVILLENLRNSLNPDPPSTSGALATVSYLKKRESENMVAPDRTPNQPPESPTAPSSSEPGKTTSPVEIFKSFRVSIDDPCYKVLPAALKKYNIADDWRQYALYVVYGDQERCLGLYEKPLILFKQLDREGRKPVFMLRKHAAPLEGHINVGVGEPAPAAVQLPEEGGMF